MSERNLDWRDEIGAVSGNHTQVAGVLAGFSATIVVLIIGLRFQSGSPRPLELTEELSLGLFTMAFFGYVATGILFSITIERLQEHRDFLFSAASITYYFSGVLGFAAVNPLISLVGSQTLRWAVAVMLIGGLIGGYLAAAIPLHDFVGVNRTTALCWLPGSAGAFGTLAFGVAEFASVDSSKMTLVALVACAVAIVMPFNVVVLTFFFPSRGSPTMFRSLLIVQMVLVTATLVFVIALALVTS